MKTHHRAPAAPVVLLRRLASLWDDLTPRERVLAFALAGLAWWSVVRPAMGGPADVVSVEANVPTVSPSPTVTADPLLQPTPKPPAPSGMYAGPGGPPDLGPPPFLTAGLEPHWSEIDLSAREHGLDPWAWAAVIVVECPLGVFSRPAPSCQYNNASRAGGLAQITDGTAATIADQSGYPCAVEKFDPMTSLRCGAYHFRDLLAASGVWRVEDELPAILVASIAYNAGGGSVAVRGARAEAEAGRDPCGGIPGGFDEQTHRYCAQMTEMWRQALEARSARAPQDPTATAPWKSPWGPRVAPGVPVPYLQASGEVGR